MNENIKKICEEIKNPVDSFDIREMILDITIPLEWSENKEHPINQAGHYEYKMDLKWVFDKEKLQRCDECLLWKLYALVQNYWLVHYKEWKHKDDNLAFNMRNNIIIKDEDVGENMLSVYEKYFEWRFA